MPTSFLEFQKMPCVLFLCSWLFLEGSEENSKLMSQPMGCFPSSDLEPSKWRQNWNESCHLRKQTEKQTDWSQQAEIALLEEQGPQPFCRMKVACMWGAGGINMHR